MPANDDSLLPDDLVPMAGVRRGPLDDVTIIDATMAYAGPFGTALLADLGANVIKVEPPTGDSFRALPPFPPDYGHALRGAEAGSDYGMAFAGVNRNKRSVCLDLKDPGDVEVFLQLCERADLITDERTATNPKRAANQAFTEAAIAAWTSTRSKQELLDLLGGRVPCGPANSMAEIFDDAHVAARGMMEECPLPGDNPTVALAANPIRVASNPTGLYQRPPTLGEHTEEVLAELGITRPGRRTDG